MKQSPPRLSLPTKLKLSLGIWVRFLQISWSVRRHPLPELVERLRRAGHSATVRTQPRQLGRIVTRVLRIGPWRPRCLFNSLVLYRLLQEQGDEAELVIGLPAEPKDKDAHAWVELHGVDVGPPPGRAQHEELARFGCEPGRPRNGPA